MKISFLPVPLSTCRLSLIMGCHAITILGLNAPVQAQQVQTVSTIFQSVTLSPHFSPDPITLQGFSGGSVPAKKIAGRSETPNGPCVGFMDETPDHTLVLTDFFNYLSLEVESSDDTTIVVSGPGGTWCNDDFKGKNPGIAGQWLAGTYSIWVGSYDPTKYLRYTIRITEVR